MTRQSTIKNPVSGSGIGLHSGNRVDIRLLPAPVNSGIVFRRTDLQPQVEIAARADLVHDTTLCTALVNAQGVRVATIEHLMSALAGLSVDNIVIEINAPEVPIMDGSAAPFVYLLQQAGIQAQDAGRRYIKMQQPVEVREGDKWARIVPFNGMRYDFRIDFDHPVLRSRNPHYRFEVNPAQYVHEISRARTFGFLKDIEFLHNNGLALGGSLDNAVVVDEFRIMNEQGLRYDDEFVRHKLLDAMGDLYLAGAPILGWYMGYKSGHDLNNKLCLAVLEARQAWCWQELDEGQGGNDCLDDYGTQGNNVFHPI